jgi:hypothetical protein
VNKIVILPKPLILIGHKQNKELTRVNTKEIEILLRRSLKLLRTLEKK